MYNFFKEKLKILADLPIIAGYTIGFFSAAAFGAIYYGSIFFDSSFSGQWAATAPTEIVAIVIGCLIAALIFRKKNYLDLTDPMISTSMNVKILGLSGLILAALLWAQSLCVSHLYILKFNARNEGLLRLFLGFLKGICIIYTGEIIKKVKNLLTKKS